MYWDGGAWAAPQGATATKQKSSGKTALIVVGVIAILFAIGKCGSADDDRASSTSSSSSTTSSRALAAPSSRAESVAETPAVAPAGSAVRDGKFEFRVVNVTRAAQAGDLSNPYMTVDAQGEFIIVTLTVQNIGDEPQSYFGANQKLIDTAGREYGSDSEASMWMNQEGGIMSDINPGNSIQVRAAFDVPPGTQPAELELHDSMFSGGVSVRL
jgi:hypothetical protein